MKYISKTTDFKLNNSIVTLGKFDGNHIGHQTLFEKAASLKKDGMNVVVFTFDIQPANMITHKENPMIFTYEEKHYQTYNHLVDYVIEYPFTEETRNMSPEDFVKDVLVDKVGVKAIVLGNDSRFGKDRAGNVGLLDKMGKQLGFDVYSMEKVSYKGREVSSTYIKEEIIKGNIDDVNIMLGKPLTMTDVVKPGKKLGRKIGFPTINFIVPDSKVMPPNGVYATKAVIDGKEYPAISNVGNRPTFDDGDVKTVETNIFDFDRDIYGKVCSVQFFTFIRPERKFSSAEELMGEIARNKEQVLDYFSKKA